MKLFVTGAGGFLGRHVVDHALQRGHEVTVLVRSGSPGSGPWAGRPGATVVVGDLRRRDPAWESGLTGCDAVVHLAAAMGGDEASQFEATVGGTEHLLAAMDAAGVNRLVHVSSFAVYDHRAVPAGGRLDESSPLETRPEERDPYARAKLRQEAVVRTEAAARGLRLTVLRPGLVYGPGRLWNAGRALQLGPLAVSIAPGSEMPLTYVGNCAEAVVLAAESGAAIGETLDIVDDDPPTRRAFEAVLREAGAVSGVTVPVPYRLAKAIGETVARLLRRWPAALRRLPSFVAPARLDALYRPVHAPNDRARAVLGWRPAVGLDEAIARSYGRLVGQGVRS